MDIQVYKYFESLKKDPNYRNKCLEILNSSESGDEILFLCFNILQSNINNENSDCIKELSQKLLEWFSFRVNNGSILPIHVKNKFAQLYTTLFYNDYLNSDSAVFEYLFKYFGQNAFQSPPSSQSIQIIDIYLRIILAIHTDIVDKTYNHDSQTQIKTSLIKDKLRLNDNSRLISSLYQIINILIDANNNSNMAALDSQTTQNETINSIIAKAFECIGLFSSWVDITLCVNDEIVAFINTKCLKPALKSFLDEKPSSFIPSTHLAIANASLKFIKELLNKKMEPIPKLQYLDFLWVSFADTSQRDTTTFFHLQQAELQTLANCIINQSTEEFTIKAMAEFLRLRSELFDSFGVHYITAWSRLLKLKDGNSIPPNNVTTNKIPPAYPNYPWATPSMATSNLNVDEIEHQLTFVLQQSILPKIEILLQNLILTCEFFEQLSGYVPDTTKILLTIYFVCCKDSVECLTGFLNEYLVTILKPLTNELRNADDNMAQNKASILNGIIAKETNISLSNGVKKKDGLIKSYLCSNQTGQCIIDVQTQIDKIAQIIAAKYLLPNHFFVHANPNDTNTVKLNLSSSMLNIPNSHAEILEQHKEWKMTFTLLSSIDFIRILNLFESQILTPTLMSWSQLVDNQKNPSQSTNTLPPFNLLERMLALFTSILEYYISIKSQLQPYASNTSLNNLPKTGINDSTPNQNSNQLKLHKDTIQNTITKLTLLMLEQRDAICNVNKDNQNATISPNTGVIMQTFFFELIGKLDKIIIRSPVLILLTLSSFEAWYGLMNPNYKLRARIVQIFCRVVKCYRTCSNNSSSKTGSNLTLNYSTANNFNDNDLSDQSIDMKLITFVQQLFQNRSIDNSDHQIPDSLSCQGALSLNNFSNNGNKINDLMSLYEIISVLIISSPHLDTNTKRKCMEDLLSNIANQYTSTLNILNNNNQKNCADYRILVDNLTTLINYTIRTTKAFSTQTVMSMFGLEQAYLTLLGIFMNSLDALDVKLGSLQNTPKTTLTNSQHPNDDQYMSIQYKLYNNVRQFFHIMLVCLSPESMSPNIISTAFMRFLQFKGDLKNLGDLISLFIQIASKYKKNSDASSFIQNIFLQLVQSILEILSKPFLQQDGNDTNAVRDYINLQQSFYNMLNHFYQNENELFSLLFLRDANIMQNITKCVINGALDIEQPVTQKICLSLLRKMIDLYGQSQENPNAPIFMNYLNTSSCLQSLFRFPLNPQCNLKDAQTIQALNEWSLCLQLLHSKWGNVFDEYLSTQIIPSILGSQNQAKEQFITALKTLDNKAFKTFLKDFYTQLKPV